MLNASQLHRADRSAGNTPLSLYELVQYNTCKQSVWLLWLLETPLKTKCCQPASQPATHMSAMWLTSMQWHLPYHTSAIANNRTREISLALHIRIRRISTDGFAATQRSAAYRDRAMLYACCVKPQKFPYYHCIYFLLTYIILVFHLDPDWPWHIQRPKTLYKFMFRG